MDQAPAPTPFGLRVQRTTSGASPSVILHFLFVLLHSTVNKKKQHDATSAYWYSTNHQTSSTMAPDAGCDGPVTEGGAAVYLGARRRRLSIGFTLLLARWQNRPTPAAVSHSLGPLTHCKARTFFTPLATAWLPHTAHFGGLLHFLRRFGAIVSRGRLCSFQLFCRWPVSAGLHFC